MIRIPLQAYKLTTQNIRVSSFGPTDPAHETEYAEQVHQLETASAIEPVMRAAYAQVFSEEEMLEFNASEALRITIAKSRNFSARLYSRVSEV
jgi:hypothetical protein